MREIVFDTETTGLDPAQGHRIVEFAGIELVDRVPTGRHLHLYFCPERPMPAAAEAVHGLSDAFLADKPRFADRAEPLCAFLEGAMLVAHNAAFDMRFLGHELERCGRPAPDAQRVIDTLELARRRFPGAKLSLDALCQRMRIDRSHRRLHGALIDAELLVEVYVELTGGRQLGFSLASSRRTTSATRTARAAVEVASIAVPADEDERHRSFVQALGPGAFWLAGGLLPT